MAEPYFGCARRPSDYAPIYCETCGETFANARGLAIHAARAHQRPGINRRRSEENRTAHEKNH